jgi:hypothetical protein
VLAAVQDDTLYKGFFQSERFFGDAASEIRAAFRVRDPYEAAFRARYSDLLEQP